MALNYCMIGELFKRQKSKGSGYGEKNVLIEHTMKESFYSD